MTSTKTIDLFFELIQVSLGNRSQLSRTPSIYEWNELYEVAVDQAVTGIAFVGIQILPEYQWAPQKLLLQWIGITEHIRLRNKEVDKETSEIWNRLKDDGLDAAILKGQGVALAYGDLAPYRQSGDIDIWIKGGYKIVCDYVQRTHPSNDLAYHRFHYDYFNDTEVELHHRPTLMRNLLDNKKLSRWYNSLSTDSFIYCDNKGFAVPPVEFNRIFILTHIYRHFLFEGIGLRQIIDYYFVLKTNGGKDKDEVGKILKGLKMTRFAGAVMWILHQLLGLEEQNMICELNEKEGRFVLDEIMQTGNFGHSDTRYPYRRLFKLRRQIAHGAHLVLHYPSEIIWTPIWLVYHKMWKWHKVVKIKKERRKSSVPK